MPNTIEVKVTGGQIYLSDGGYTKAPHGATVNWVIRDNGDFPVISIVPKASGMNIWNVYPRSIGRNHQYSDRWQGIISRDSHTVPEDSEYDYDISVKDNYATYPTLDPKIAVKSHPISVESLIRKLAKHNYILLLTAVFSLLLLQILRKKKK